jgi:hypothetical protein
MNRVLYDLESREQAAAAAAEDGAPTAHPEVDYVERVSRQLALLEVRVPELERAAEAVLSATDPDRVRLLYTDLVQRISDANRVADALVERRYEIAELRAQLEGLPDPDPVEALLDHAAAAVERGDDVLIPLGQARAAITHQLDAAAAEADREFVRQAVAESLTEMGYEVADVTVETPDSLVFRQNGTHGLRAHIRDGEIDLRTVRLGSGKDAGADRGAEDEFCRRMPGLLAAMSLRGVAAGVKDQKLPGLFAPETVPLRRKAGPTPPDHQQQPVTRKRTGR